MCYLISSVVISVRVPERGVCVHISGQDVVWYVCDVLYAVLYVRVGCFVVRGCAVSSRYPISTHGGEVMYFFGLGVSLVS